MASQHSINTGDSNLDTKITEWLQWNKVCYSRGYLLNKFTVNGYILSNVFIRCFLYSLIFNITGPECGERSTRVS